MPEGYYRYPTIHQDTVVFVSEDDLWSVSTSGGVARRLTSNLGKVSHPVLSPDGDQLAFVGSEEGETEVYCMPASGGAARRLTYLGGGLCLTLGWTGDGEIVLADNAEHWYPRFTYLYTLDPAGGEPQRLNYGLARSIAFGPGGGVVLGRNTDEPARWKRYRGGTTGRLWIDLNGRGEFQPLLPGLGNLASPMWLCETGTPGRVYFISDHEGTGNLYSCLPTGVDLRRHTHHEDYYARNASSDGRRIVYHAGADLYLYDPATGSSNLIPIAYHSPRVQRNRKFVPSTSYLENWTLHPKGQATAIVARGKLFAFSNWEGPVAQLGEADNALVEDGHPLPAAVLAAGRQAPGGSNRHPG
jgi:tricorn protease